MIYRQFHLPKLHSPPCNGVGLDPFALYKKLFLTPLKDALSESAISAKFSKVATLEWELPLKIDLVSCWIL